MINEYVKNLSNNQHGCKSVVGDENSVNILASLSENNSDLFLMVGIHGMATWKGINGDGRYSSEEMAAFKDGLDFMQKFMLECSQERLATDPEKV